MGPMIGTLDMRAIKPIWFGLAAETACDAVGGGRWKGTGML